MYYFYDHKIDTYKTEAPEEFKEAETPLKNHSLKMPLKTIHFSPAAVKCKHFRLAIAKPVL